MGSRKVEPFGLPNQALELFLKLGFKVSGTYFMRFSWQNLYCFALYRFNDVLLSGMGFKFQQGTTFA